MKRDLIPRIIVALLITACVVGAVWALHIHHISKLNLKSSKHKVILND